jgi:hypothetical protein
MRRFFSITTILAMMSSFASPLLASTCRHVVQPAACHRAQTQKPHCNMMHHHDDSEAPKPESSTTVAAGDPSPASCPMDCCLPGHPTSAAVIAATPAVPTPAIVLQNLQFVSLVFTSAGFSSHTDRGPPTA